MSVVKNLMVRVGADFSAITKQSKKASNSIKTMQASVTASANKINRAMRSIGIGISFAALASAAKDAYNAYSDQIEAETKLASVMKTTMGATDDEVRSILDLAAAQQKLGIVGDEVQLAGAQELATYLEQTSSLQTLIPVLNDMVAQQYGYSASAEQAANIATMLGKVMEGQVGGLSRYGYYFDEAQSNVLKYGTEAERAAVLADIVEGSVGGMNYALAQTPVGRMKQLSNVLGDIKEQFGQAVATVATVFMPVLQGLANALATIAALANRVAQAIANIFGKKLSAGTAAVSTGSAGASVALDDMTESAEGAGAAAKKAQGQLMGFDELNKLSDTSASGGSGTSAGGGIDLGDSGLGSLSDAIDEPAESATWLERALQRVKDLVESLDFNPLTAAFERLSVAASYLGDVLLGYLSSAFDKVLAPLAHWTIEEFVPALVTLLASAFNLLGAVLEKLQPIFDWLWENVLEPLRDFTWDLIIDGIEWITQKIQDLTDLINGNTTFREWLDTLSPAEKIIGSIAVAILAVSIAIGVVNGVITGITTAVGLAKTAFTLISSPIGIAVLAIAALIFIGVELYQHWDEIKAKAEELKEKLIDVWTKIKESIQKKIQAIKDKFNDLMEKWSSVKDNISEKVDSLKEKWNDFKESAGSVIDAVGGFISGLWATVSGPINDVIGGLSSVISWAQSAASSVGSAISSWNEAANSRAAQIAADGSIYLQGFASGGFLSSGQVYVARENGAQEMVGSFGNQGAVANNDQIVAGISSGVYSAVVAAMSAQNSSRSVSLNINGREFMRAVYDDSQAVANERGIRLVTG